MIVKTVKSYRDTLLDMALVPCSTENVEILIKVSDKRAKDLIEAGVAEKYIDEKETLNVLEDKPTVNVKEEKKTNTKKDNK